MGVVYRAQDETLRRDVALKVLPANLVGDAQRRARFLREARAAAAVTHPNIAAIYEAGEANGEMFLAMELVQGKSLRACLSDGPLPIPTAVGYAVEVAEGLSRAHDSRIVHRDLKPENILIGDDGHPKILDFGLAKILENQEKTRRSNVADEETVTEELTRQGMAVGTPVYMSPEQARGDPVDYRTDIFSFGITLYEMVTGKVPFRGKTPLDTLSAIISQPTPPPSEIDPRIPPQLEKLLLRCLDKDAGKRYQQTGELAAELRELKQVSASRSVRVFRSVRRRLSWAAPAAIVAILVLLVGLNVFGIRERLRGALAGPEITSIAVLPLQNLSGDPEQEYFSAGITEALINKLGQLGSLNVTSRTSVAQFKDSTLSLPEIAQALGVDAVVEGSVLRVTNRVAVTARLVEAATDRQLWSDNFEHDVLDVLNVPTEVARNIARNIRLELTPEDQRRLEPGESVDPEAYDLYLRGRYELAHGYSSVTAEKALELFQNSIDLAQDFALAHAAVAEVYSRVTTRFSPKESIERGQAAARRALELDDSLGIAYAALGKIKYLYEWDWVGAEEYLKNGLEREPGDVSVLQMYGMYLALSGRVDEGVELFERAVRLDPLTLTTRQQLALGYAWARRFDESLIEYQKMLDQLEQSPNPTVEWGVHYQLANVYMFSDRLEEARVEIEAAGLEEEAEGHWLTILEGDLEAGHEDLEWLESRPPGERMPFQLAAVSALLGEHDKAFAALDQMIEMSHPLVGWLKVYPVFDSLRDDPRFDEVLRKAGLPPTDTGDTDSSAGEAVPATSS
jgi:TolB-like protein/Tfp pilus assembly protein PilF